ncbi:MAG: dihydroorotase [Candidatus Thorarchaeota archaeon]|nr:dihydroorotase [Candidatus Thorarchaeota archaeon]
MTASAGAENSNNVDLVIRNAQLLLESGLVRGGIAVSNGKICALSSDAHLPEAVEVIDADSKILMPGLIDAHAHIHDSEMDDHEDFTTGSRAAAAGGVTTFIDMPLVGQTDTVSAADAKIKLGEDLSIVDFSLNSGMLNDSNYTMIPHMIPKGVASFKAFTCPPFYANTGVITRALSEVAEYGGIVTIHSEDQGIIEEFSKDMDGDWDAPISHALARPPLAEQLAIRQNIAIADETGGHLHIAHVTTKGGIHEIERGRLRGVIVTTEVCPHHLTFYRDDMNRLGPKSKMNPPLRTKEDRASLWSALLRGSIEMVVSDHAPCPLDKKEVGQDDIREAWSGVDGIQMILRVLLSEGINKGRISFKRLLQVTSSNPAKIFGLYPRKGVLQVGSDADMVLIDLTKEEKISADMMFSKCGWTIYEGMKMTGVPLMTFVRGQKVFEFDRTTVKPGHGRFQPMGGVVQREEG